MRLKFCFAFCLSLSFPLLFTLGSCKAVEPAREPETQLQAEPRDTQLLEAKDLHREAVFFHKIFAQVADTAGFSKDEFERLLFLPKVEQLMPTAEALRASDQRALLEALEEHLRKFSLAGAYQEGVSTATPLGGELQRWFRERGPLTFIVFPALYSEFPGLDTSDLPFKAAFEAESYFRRTYQSSLRGLEDSAYDLKTGKTQPIDLSERLELGSLDSDLGAAGSKIQLVYLKPAWGSLESFDSLSESGTRELRRLKKVFERIPLENLGSIYFVGLSRGALLALEVLAKASQDPKAYPFMKKVHGLVSLSGPLYGSPLLDEQHGTLAPLAELEKVLGELRVPAEGPAYLDAKNRSVRSASELYQVLWSSLGDSFPDPFLARRYARFWLQELMAPSTLAGSQAEREAALKASRLVIKKIRESLSELSLASRIQWWSTHLIPENLHYYAAMGSYPAPEGKALPLALAESPYFAIHSPEIKAIFAANAKALEGSRVAGIHDGQLPEALLRFWPQFAPLFNPQQKPYHFHYLGLLGTHHWGLFQPRVWPLEKSLPESAFPESVLLEAIGGVLVSPKS